jgi:hypothetical protein
MAAFHSRHGERLTGVCDLIIRFPVQYPNPSHSVGLRCDAVEHQIVGIFGGFNVRSDR